MTEIFNILKSSIKAVIRDNKNQEITGPILQKVLLDIVDSLAVYYPKSTQNLSLRIGTTVFNADDKGKMDIGSTPFTHVTRGIEPAPGEEVDLGSKEQFNQIYAAEFIEGSKSLSEKYIDKDSANKKYATKEEASDFINVGEQPSLESAIMSIPHRVGLQVVTFANTSTEQRKKFSLWFPTLSDKAKVGITIGDISFEAEAIGGTVAACNKSIYDAIVTNEKFSDLFYSYSFNESYNSMVFELLEELGDSFISAISDASSATIKILKAYHGKDTESYQLKYDNTEDEIFTNPANWDPYTAGEDLWNTW